MITFIWIALFVLAAGFALILGRDIYAHRMGLETSSWLKTGIIGFIVNFFDVLGIGSFAPQIALLKFARQTDDRVMPGTLNVSNTLPVLVEAILFIKIVEVDPLTLILLIASASIGGVLGARIVSGFSVRKVRITVAIALLVTAFFMLAGRLGWIAGGGESTGLSTRQLLIAIPVNCILGALNAVGIGLYAPCMALVFSMGMSPKVAFPIMMGSCAFLMPAASVKFIKAGAYNRKASCSMAISGLAGVLVAAFIVKMLPLDVLKWLVLAVVVITSLVMFRSAYRGDNKAYQ